MTTETETIKDWKTVELQDVANVDSGGNAPQGEAYFKNGKYPFIRVQHFNGSRVYVDRFDLINDDAIKKYRLKKFGKDSIVFPKSGASIRLEKRAMLPTDAYVVGHLCIVKPKQIDGKFLYYVLKQEKFATQENGSTLPFLNVSHIKRKRILIPENISEQKSIAQVLTTVQEAITGHEELFAKLKELKRGIMQYLFTHGTKGEKTKMTEIGGVPESWEIGMLGKVAEIQQGKQVSKKNRIGDNQKPFLRTANVFWNKIDLSDLDEMNFSKDEEEKFKLRFGDLLICEGGDVGRTAMWKNEMPICYYQNHLHRVRVNQKINSYFLLYWLSYALEYTNVYLGRANNTTIPNLSKSKLQQFEVPLPGIEEQNIISNFFVMIDRRIDSVQNKLSVYQSLFKTMLHELISGERRVT
jgi:restriction endonuclease S subunit